MESKDWNLKFKSTINQHEFVLASDFGPENLFTTSWPLDYCLNHMMCYVWKYCVNCSFPILISKKDIDGFINNNYIYSLKFREIQKITWKKKQKSPIILPPRHKYCQLSLLIWIGITTYFWSTSNHVFVFNIVRTMLCI